MTTVENTAQTWRDLTDGATDQQVAMLADDERSPDMFDAASLLFLARDQAACNVGAAVHGADWWNE